MVEASPKVPPESQTNLQIPLFPANTLLMTLSRAQADSIEYGRQVQRSSSISPRKSENQPCHCPHIIVSDDDPFQNMYYKILFESIASAKKESTDIKSPLRFELFVGGEGLLERFHKMKACGCESLSLVVTDYDMGLHHLNGVETVTALRKAGYTGFVAMRTSEERSYLCKRHPDFEGMLNSGFINTLMEKNNLKKCKEALEKVINTRSG